MTDWWMDPVILGSIGVIALALYLVFRQFEAPNGIQMVTAGASAVLIVGAVIAAVGLGSLTTAPDAGQLGGASWEVTASKDATTPEDDELVIDNVQNRLQVQMQYDISDADFILGTESIELNFTVARSDLKTTKQTTTAEIISIGLVEDSSGSGKTYPIAAKYSDGTFKLDWEKGPDANPVVINDFTTLTVDSGDTSFVRLNVTLNAEAVGQMDVYDSALITLRVGDELFTIDCLLTVKQA